MAYSHETGISDCHSANAVIPKFAYKSDHDVARLETHDVLMRGDNVTLRPMTEDDWGFLFEWNNDPEVMEHADQDDFSQCTLVEAQSIYRWISTHAYCFIIEVDGRAIGECWLQPMNLRRIVDQFPDKNLWRIDLMIRTTELWGRGYGSETITLLVDFGFRHEGAGAIFGILSADNTRSVCAFKKCGFRSHGEIPEKDGSSGLDMVVTGCSETLS